MERKLQERMIGAGVLVVLLALVAPLLLDGTPQGSVDAGGIPGQRPDELRTHTFSVGGSAERPADAAAAPAERGGPATPATPPPSPAVDPAPAATTSAAAEPAAKPAPVTPPPPVPAVVAAPAPKAPVVAPESEVAPTAAAPKSSAPDKAPAAGTGSWLVQVGTFGQKENAERLATGLKGKGFAAAVSPTIRGGKTMYRVRVGPAGSKDEARAVADRLRAAGQAGQVVAR